MSVEVAVIGKGGREQALIRRIAQSPHVGSVIAIPGNPGSEYISEEVDKPIINIRLSNEEVPNVMEIIDRCRASLVIVGPDAWLAKGLGNALEKRKTAAIAPTKEAAQLETSKVFTRKLCQKLGIQQPRFADFETIQDAIDYINQNNMTEGVIKADGLAEGKGAIVCDSRKEMFEAIYALRRKFPEASQKFLVEERVYGQETSYIVLTDGKNYKTLPPARD